MGEKLAEFDRLMALIGFPLEIDNFARVKEKVETLHVGQRTGTCGRKMK